MPTSFDDAPVKIVISGNTIDGSIVALGEFEVTIAIDEFLGEFVADAELIIDLTFILKKLRDKIELHAAEIASNRLSRKAMGFESATSAQTDPTYPDKCLFSAQQIALRKCLGGDFVMVWGPPGTGKTHVLARLLREEVLSGRSVLLLSNTNIAVDQALESFLMLCEVDDQAGSILREMLEQGKFVRAGTPQLRIDQLILDNVIQRLNRHVRSAIEEKQSKLEQLEHILVNTKRTVEQLRRLTKLLAASTSLSETLQSTEISLVATSKQAEGIENELTKSTTDLDVMLKKRGIGGFFSRLGEPALRQKVSQLTRESAQVSVIVQTIKEKITLTKNSLNASVRELKEHSIGAGTPSEWPSRLTSAEVEVERLRTATTVLSGEIAELESKLADVRDKVLSSAQLVACTCAKSTLDKIISERKFDTVITDESSMVSIPQALWASSMGQSKYLCFGDFRQLPPITAIDAEEDPSSFGLMHSSPFEQNMIGLDSTSLRDSRLAMLDQQRRMPEQLCNLVNQVLYEGRLRTHSDAPTNEEPITVISTDGYNAWCDKTEGFSWYNWHHAFVVVELARKLHAEGNFDSGIATRIMILTPFRAQVEIINALLKEAELPDVISASTVWRSQGREAEIVVFDTVCAPPYSRPGRWFLDEDPKEDGARLINVAVTRAKRELYVVGHMAHLLKACPVKSIAAKVLRSACEVGKVIDSRKFTEDSLPKRPDQSGGYAYETFPSGNFSVFDETGFERAFAEDIASMCREGVITVFSPFLNEKSVALWGPLLRDAIKRNCRVEIFTRKPSQQTSFLSFPAVEKLIEELRTLGALVGFDKYIPGKPVMHQKVAILQFPRGLDKPPIIWKGSMNPLGHYASSEIMDRTESEGLFEVMAKLLNLQQLRSAIDAKDILSTLERFLISDLKAHCPKHKVPLVLKFGRNAKFKSFFMSCPHWKSNGCENTVNVDITALNKALQGANVRCLNEECERPVEARNGRTGVYFKCESGHFLNLRY